MNVLLAFVGMTGSGKSTAAECLVEQGWTCIRFGQVTIDKLKEAGREIDPENEKTMREALRRQHGMGAFATLSLPAIEQGIRRDHVVIDGLYSWSEYIILKDGFGDGIQVAAIYASPRTRYHRLRHRTREPDDTAYRMRPLTPEQARARDYAEIENIEKGGPIAMADCTIVNESDIEDFRARVRAYAARLTEGSIDHGERSA